MNAYNVVLFLHVTGAIAYFIGIGIALFGLFALRGARHVEQVRALARFLATGGPLMGAGVLLLLVTGLTMAFMAWGGLTVWMDVTLATLVLLVPLGTALIEPRRRGIVRLAEQLPDGPVPAELFARTHDGVLLTGTQMVVAVLLGIVFLMTNKPALVASIVVILVALLLGVLSGVPFLRPRGARETAPDAGAREQIPGITERQPVV